MADARRSILITGSASGIGRHAALGLHAEGWRVFAAVRRSADEAALAAAGLETLRLDYTDAASIEVAFDRVMQLSGGRLDALFNNGGTSLLGAVEDITTAQLRAQFEANFFGWHDLTRRVLPVMRAQGRGRIVQCSSILGLVSGPYRGAYAASKHALEALTDAMRMELVGTGIKVILIEPGPIATGLFDKGVKRFGQEIAKDASPHQGGYDTQLARLTDHNRFRRGPEAVLTALRHALESGRPRPRYRVTIPAKGGAMLRRLLPTRLLDRVLMAS